MAASPASVASPLQRLSTFKSPTTTATATATSPLDTFAADPIFSAFLSPSFSSTSFSSAALSSGSPASTAEKLQQAIRLLESQLRSEVLSRHSDLLSQLSSLQHADHALSTVRSSVHSLQSSLRHTRSELSDPLRSINALTLQLSNLHATSELLHHTLRALRLSKKLRDLAVDPEKIDLAKAAQLHCEILALYNEYDLAGIEVVEEELTWVREIGETLRTEAMKALELGMEGLNQGEVAIGLQVFYNLGELKPSMEKLITKYKGMGVKSVSVALDMKAISGSVGSGFGPGGIRGSGTPQIGGGAKARDALWQRMGTCMDQLHSIMVAVWHLQKVLSKKRDPFTHVLLLDEVIKEGEPMITDRVWEALVKAFANQMKSAFSASSFVKEIFTLGYPKLFAMIDNLLERISRDTDVKGVLPAITSEGKQQLVAAVEIFQTSFLALCLGRLSELVNTVFPVSSRGSVPSKDHISRIISRIQEEIESVQLDARLTLLVLREIGKVLLLLAERAEYQISTGPEARQVNGPATPAQLKNFILCQHLQEIHTRISSMISGMPSIAADVLSPALGAIYGVACDSVTTLFQAMLDRLESCIFQIHEQKFGVLGMDAAVDNNASPYMEEYWISTGPEARQVNGPATPAQLKNFILCQHLQEIHTRISSMISGMPSIAADVLSPALGAIYGVACDSVTTLFQAMLDRLESCIFQIHEQKFGVLGMDAAVDNNASPYMEELQKCILHFRSEFLSRLLPSKTATVGVETICTRLVRSMAARVLIFFIRHASLVRPLSESGKLRMARDMAELELAVGQNLFPVEQLGAPYRALRAFRPLIFLETSQLGASPLLQDLPLSVILHHLYSRGPDELQSPLQRNKLTPLQYSLWLDSQGEDQVWKGIKATLDDYAIHVRARGDRVQPCVSSNASTWVIVDRKCPCNPKALMFSAPLVRYSLEKQALVRLVF